jgi:hypothetical protein
MKVYQISTITLKVKDMEKSCSLSSKIPSFRLTYGGKPSDHFTTFEIGEGSNVTYLNLEQIHDEGSSDFYKIPNLGKTRASEDFGRVIFHTENVDKLYSYMKQDKIYIPQSTLCLKKNLPMLHGGRKVLSYSRTKRLSIIVCTASHYLGRINNLLVIVVFYFASDCLAVCQVIIDTCPELDEELLNTPFTECN